MATILQITTFCEENTIGSVTSKLVAILFRPQYITVKQWDINQHPTCLSAEHNNDDD